MTQQVLTGLSLQQARQLTTSEFSPRGQVSWPIQTWLFLKTIYYRGGHHIGSLQWEVSPGSNSTSSQSRQWCKTRIRRNKNRTFLRKAGSSTTNNSTNIDSWPSTLLCPKVVTSRDLDPPYPKPNGYSSFLRRIRRLIFVWFRRLFYIWGCGW